jgi:hypothetical protein
MMERIPFGSISGQTKRLPIILLNVAACSFLASTIGIFEAGFSNDVACFAKGGGGNNQAAAQQRAAQARQAAQQHAAQARQAAQQRAQQSRQQAQARQQQAQQRQAQQMQEGRQRQQQQAAMRQEQAQQRNEFRQQHPGRAEVLGRDSGLNNRINQDKGDLNGHYGQLRAEDTSIRRQEQIDAARNGGHLTGQEYRQLNGEENGLSRQISRDNYGRGNASFQAAHPLRSEVLGRDVNLNNQINQDAGDLGGHYSQLKAEDNSIRHQEQVDAAHNGGYLTGQEYRQLNGEENGLARQVSRDNYGAGDASFQAAHPGRSEVLGRDAHLNSLINQDAGDLSGHYSQLKAEDYSIRRQEQVDAARNGGHLTGQEYQQLNREESGLSRQIGRDNYGAGDAAFQAAHPGRSEVLGRDAHLNNLINQDGGDLSGHYGQLKAEDTSIRRQEQIDAARNGGHLTGQEYQQLNREENGLSRQINRDNYGAGDAAFQAAHPARSQVLGTDAGLNNQINQDRGHLSGQYNQLKSEDYWIRRQEQIDAARNGGHLSPGQYRQLTNEEAGLRNQIQTDNQ